MQTYVDTSVTASKHNKPIYALQMLRGFSAFLVVVSHLILRINETDTAVFLSYCMGDLGVQTFFVISGFVIISSAQNGFGSWQHSLGFMKRRAWRIIPLYWIVSAFACALIIRSGSSIDPHQFLADLLFLPTNTVNGELRPLLAQGWTLNYEMQFYIVFSLCLLFKRRLAIILLVLFFLALFGIGSATKPIWETRNPSTPLEFWTDPIILNFLVGVMLGCYARPLLAGSRERNSIMVVIAAGSIHVIALGYTLGAGGLQANQLVIKLIVMAAAALSVLICLVPNKMSDSLTSRTAYELGNASFSTYLVHQFALRWALRALATNDMIIVVVVPLFAAHLLGLAVHFAIEKPLLRMSR